jgi:hypothetical protein
MDSNSTNKLYIKVKETARFNEGSQRNKRNIPQQLSDD